MFFLFLAGITVSSNQETKNTSQKLQWARERFEENRPSLSAEQTRICQIYLSVLAARQDDADKKLIELYNDLYKSSVGDPQGPGHTLWKCFGIDYTGIPLLVAQVCRDSDAMSYAEKLREVNAQAEKSKDYRIDRIVIDLLFDGDDFQEAIAYCENLTEEDPSRDEYKYFLVEAHLRYNEYLFNIARKTQGIEMDQVINMGIGMVEFEHRELDKAIKIAKKHIQSTPSSIKRYAKLISFQTHFTDYVLDPYKVQAFKKYCLSVLQRNGDLGSNLKDSEGDPVIDKIRTHIKEIRDHYMPSR